MQAGPRADVIVVGTGGVGSAALFQLAKRGVSVVGLDRFPPGHDRGSSHGETRVIRQAYFEHPDYVPLALRAYQLWHELEAEAGTRLLVTTGLLQAGPPDGEVIRGVLRAASEHGLELTALTTAQALGRFPAFRFDPTSAIVFEHVAGYLRVESCVQTHVAAALAAGGQWQAAQVVAWSESEQGVEVKTTTGTLQADRLILTVGPWSNGLLPVPFPAIRVLKKHLHWYRCRDPRLAVAAGCPIYLVENDRGIFYGFPSVAEQVKLAEHTGGTPVTGDISTQARGDDPRDRERVESFIRQTLPGLGLERSRHDVCFYSMSHDHHFYLGPLPGSARIFVAAGLSGHGFKFTPVLGEALADLALDGQTALPVEFLRCDRELRSGMGRSRGPENDG